jgi:hypothetical protein
MVSNLSNCFLPPPSYTVGVYAPPKARGTERQKQGSRFPVRQHPTVPRSFPTLRNTLFYWANMQHYAYQPLSAQSIRVLTLKPASDFNAPLRCRLTNVNLNREEISYEALSYVWASKTGTNPLSCEGRELLITPNCESALRHLRFKCRDRNLWVDAICIDQKSISEREHQVKMMGDVFGKATQVLIWLGDSNSETALAFAYLRTLYAWYWLPFSSVIIEVLIWKWIDNGMPSADKLHEHVSNQKL